MTMTDTTAAALPRFNPVFWLMWLLPASAVVAGLATLAIALQGADRALPADYHWEGERLDADFTRVRTAAALGVGISLEVRDGQCHAVSRNLPVDPSALDLLLTHGSDAGLDRRVRLPRIAPGEYRAGCAPLEPGKWRVAVSDDAARWTLRVSAQDFSKPLELRARSPDGIVP
jgi:uncharacterized protein